MLDNLRIPPKHIATLLLRVQAGQMPTLAIWKR